MNQACDVERWERKVNLFRKQELKIGQASKGTENSRRGCAAEDARGTRRLAVVVIEGV